MNQNELYKTLAVETPRPEIVETPKPEVAVVEPQKSITDEEAGFELDNLATSLYEQYEKLSPAQRFVAEVAPGTGEAISAYETPKYARETKEAFEEGNYGQTAIKGLLTAMSAIGAVPILGTAVRAPKAIIKAGLKVGMSKVDESKLVKNKFNYSKKRIMGKGESRLYFNDNETLGLMEIGKDFGSESKRMYQILMRDKNNKPTRVGKVVLAQKPDGDSKIQHLVNIEIDKKERGKGIGEYIVNMLSDYSDDAKGFAIKDIQKKALPFWKKLGLFDTTKKLGRTDGFVPNTSTNFKNAYKLEKTQRRAQPDKLKELAKQVEEGKVTKTKWDEEVKKLNPVSMFEEMPTVPSFRRIQAIVGNKATNKVIGKDISLESLNGKRISNRLDIPSYDNYDTWVPTMHELGAAKGEPGKVIGYGQTAVLKNVDFHTPDMQRPIKMALKVAQGKSKSPFAGMEGTFKNTPVEEAYNKASEILEQIKKGESDYIQVGYNPQRASYFYDRATGLPVLNAEEVIQVGPLVLAKKPIIGKAADFKFEKGGYVHNYIEGL